MISAIVFDLDGTLIDSLKDITKALNGALMDVGAAPKSIDEVRGLIGKGARELVRGALASDDNARTDVVLKRFFEHYGTCVTESTRPYPQILEMLLQLKAWDLVLAVATNKPSVFTERILDELGFRRVFPLFAASADEVLHRKPAPDVIRLALQRASGQAIRPNEVMYVGDSEIDVATARSFGACFGGVTWGFQPESLVRAGAEVIFSTPDELLAWTQQRNQPSATTAR